MKHLVIAVSPDSSLELLGSFAEIIVLDKDPVPDNLTAYDTLYIRSHFAQAATLPQNFRTEIADIVNSAKRTYPSIKFVDNVSDVDTVLSFEDKWLQYRTYSDFMPRTRLFSRTTDTASFTRPVYKHRFSSRGNGVFWDINEVNGPTEDWIVQESLDIAEELRIYVICGEVYPMGAIRQSKTLEQNTQAVDARVLTSDEIDFVSSVGMQDTNLDLVGLDIARTSDGQLSLIEVNRSPGFAAFVKLTGANLASLLYDKL